MKILIIDDDEDIREVAQLTLELQEGWTVLTAGSGETGITIAKQEQPDAILLDVMMPQMDGFATLERLQADSNTQSIPVIFLTAKVSSVEANATKELVICGSIVKPFDPLILGEQIRTILAPPS
ncbi:response regulator [Geitlerinema sp. PCC 9228]|jgi:DNA-binding response OmpR family regulator|uniref:response regulator n=1 Tax=Geitlerinema sp. PCC 9228 TaxID=111611 RepID=UPI0008F9CBED|nr:response regulator [Geitlerinema sp. PCC 9228]